MVSVHGSASPLALRLALFAAAAVLVVGASAGAMRAAGVPDPTTGLNLMAVLLPQM